MNSFAISAVAVLVSFIGYAVYFRGILSGKTKPHAFSWFVWGVLTAIVAAAQFAENAGFGAWITGLTALACFTISVLALKFERVTFPLLDWICLIGALFSIALWAYLKDPMISVVLVCLIDFIALIPNIRKAYNKPFEENPFIFATGALKFFLSLFVLSTFNLTTALYPIYTVIVNTLFVLLIIIKRKQVKITHT